MKCIPDKAEILLINPPSGIFYGLGPNFAPIGLFSLAAFLETHGFQAAVLNANFFPDYQTSGSAWSGSGRPRPEGYYYAQDQANPVWEQVLDFIEAVEPKLIGFSCHDLAVGGIKLLAKSLKERDPGRLVAVGGPTPSGAADIFDDCLDVDFLLAGEGEITLLELAQILRVNDWQAPASHSEVEALGGLYHRSGGRLIFNGPRRRLPVLDDLPDARRDYYWLDYERRLVIRDVQLNGVATSRGCLKMCRFCGARTIWPGPVRYRSIERVIGEVADLRRSYGEDFQHFSIFDDDFLARPDRVNDFCGRLRELEGDYKFRCYGRVNNLQNEEMIETLIKTGCQEIWVGVESGSQKVLKAMGKGITVSQIKRLDQLFHNYDFPWLAFIILGTPPESEADIELTLNLLRAGHFPNIQPFTFQPYTGTDFFRQLRAEGRLDYDDIIRGHQNLPQCFSQLVEPERFWQLLEQLNQLAADRRENWFPGLSPVEVKEAELWEMETAKFLSAGSDGFVALGPERQLRWLAALNHYQGLGADLTLVDAEAVETNSTRFGTILTPSEAEVQGQGQALIVAPEDQIDRWRETALALYPARKAVVLGQGGGFEPGRRPIWRPVAELCRRYSAG